VIDDFRGGAIWRGSSRTSIGSRRQDKGFDAQFALIGDVLAGKHPAPPAERYLLSTMATLAAARSLETGLPETIVEPAGEPAAEPVTR
jgi:hypothetical protein